MFVSDTQKMHGPSNGHHDFFDHTLLSIPGERAGEAIIKAEIGKFKWSQRKKMGQNLLFL